MDVKGKRIIVTGGNGFIGSSLVNNLLDNGAYVRVIDYNDTYHEFVSNNFQYCRVDIRDYGKLSMAFAPADVVIHMAAIKDNDDKDLDSTNIYGTMNVIRHTVNNHIRKFIFISSAAVYGNNRIKIQDETAPLRPINEYGISKYCGEKIITEVVKESFIDLKILRLFNVYGPGVISKVTNLSLIPAVIKSIMNKSIFEFKKDTIRDYVYIDDVINSIKFSIDDKSKTKIYNVCTGEGKSTLDVMNIISDKLNSKCNFVYSNNHSEEILISIGDNTEILETMKIENFVSLDKGLDKTIEFFLEFPEMLG